MKKNLSKVFGVLIAVLSLTGLAACLVNFNKTENVSSASSSNNTTSTDEENPPIPFVEENESYKFEHNHSYRIPLDKLQIFFGNLYRKTVHEQDESELHYETLLDLDFSLMNLNLNNVETSISPEGLGFPVYLFNGTTLPNGDRFTNTIENFAELVCSIDFWDSGPQWNYGPGGIEFRRIPQLTPLYSECRITINDYLLLNEDEDYQYGIKMQFDFDIPSENLDDFTENKLVQLYEFGSTYGSFLWPKDLNQDGSASCTFVMDIFEINYWSEFSLTGSLEGFVFNKAAQVSINERWSDDVFNAWMYANLYAEEMSL